MKITITITHDDGSTVDVAVNDRLAQDPVRRTWKCDVHIDKLRTLDGSALWAMSHLCFEMAMKHLPIDPTSGEKMRAACAFHGHAPWQSEVHPEQTGRIRCYGPR